MNDLPDFHKMLSSNRDFCKNRLSDVDILLKSINDISLLIFMLASLGKKGKTIPLQAWTGPEGSRRLRLPDFKTIGT
jgi:hypothetical protein